jgi:hypothetical protein
MILRCEKDFGVKFVLTQGCCNKGGVSASAGTHDCEGVVDFSVNGLTMSQANKLVRALRKVGFAAWYRPYIKGLWGAHIHAVAVGCKNLPKSAANQVSALRNGRDGLKSNRLDPHRGLKLPVITFEKYKESKKPQKPVIDISATINKARQGDFRAHLGAIMRAEGVPQTKIGYSRLQKRMGYTGKAADGIPGPESLKRLAKEHGYPTRP